MKNPNKPTTGVFVSAFLANHVIPEMGEHVEQFDIRGAGHGWWETSGDSIALLQDLFVMIHFVNVRPKGYEVTINITDESNKVIWKVGKTNYFEVSKPYMNYTFNQPLQGVELPIGFFHLWVCVDEQRKAVVSLRVFGPNDPPAT